ncbi:MAG: hypothetical protein AB7P33_11125 [Dehalococcoidia bacterium]
MAFLKTTMLEPKPGCEDELHSMLEEFDASSSGMPGLLFSLVVRQDARRIGRTSLWLTRDGANREMEDGQLLALWSRLRRLSATQEERLLEVSSGHLPQDLTSLQGAAKLPAYFPSSARQMALPAA